MSTQVAAPPRPASGPNPTGSSPFVALDLDAPIRAELLGADGLDERARRLAAACAGIDRSSAESPVLKRFAANAEVLLAAYTRITGEISHDEARGLDTEWLADNFHIVREVLREVKKDLPTGYLAELPKLKDGPMAGYPRVYALAMLLVAHGDAGLDEARIDRAVVAFQVVTALTIGELWAVPTMLRLVLLENLRRLADRMIDAWDDRRAAEDWEVARGRAGGVGSLPKAISDPFLVRLIQVSRDAGPKAANLLEMVETRLGRDGDEANEALRREHSRQAASQVSVGNSVTSLRLLAALDWNAFFERTSPVEAALRRDPGRAYARQDFATRDRDRREVEALARGAHTDELNVARLAVQLAEAQKGGVGGHVAYFLADAGRPALEAAVGYKPSRRARLHRAVVGHAKLSYFGAILALMGLFLALFAWAGVSLSGAGVLWAGLMVLALLVPASELAVGLVNHLFTMFLPPTVLPKLEFKDGIPEDCATFIVMPSMLTRPDSASLLLDRLEIHHLANPDEHFRFALLTDFSDAPHESMPEDDSYIKAALEGVAALNEKYAEGGTPRFFLFHRRRIFDRAQGCWMGWERKRGKLSEFNRLLRGATDTSYAVRSAPLEGLPRTRFVITLDTDTQMTRDTARRLVGTLAHPLVQPRFDRSAGRVVGGHGVLQPRVSYVLAAASRSRFAAIHAASAGIDPYSTAISDTYMDLFGAGSFTGKGIYDVDAFEAATGQTFPTDQILSHDLIEGNYARCGLVTDIELFDDFPPRYHSYARREHRWVRGDWQLLPWLGRTVPTAEGRRPNPLPAAERWKVFDNLRRSVVPPSVVLLLVLGWTVLPGPAWFWTLVALLVPGLPVVQQVLGAVVGALRSGSLAWISGLIGGLPSTFKASLLTITFLADQARLLVHATTLTLYRLLVTRKNLLEWETAAAAESRLGAGLSGFVRTMWQASALAGGLAATVAIVRPSSLWAAAPVLAAWALSPLVAYWVSTPRRAVETPLSAAERDSLRRIARRTWHFFETFVGDADNWLPPDNYQEAPEPKVAHRTSPTNQGLLLLSTISAHDLGYLSMSALASRLGKTIDTFEAMEQYQGHFYNWYETTTLSVLPPGYISTVDSGNLFGCLLTTKQALLEKRDEPLVGPPARHGLADTLGLLGEAARASKPNPGAAAAEAHRELESDLAKLGATLKAEPEGLHAWDDWLGCVEWAATALAGRAQARGSSMGAPDPVGPWAEKLLDQVRRRRSELAELTPWVGALAGVDLGGSAVEARWLALRSALLSPPSLSEIASSSAAWRAELAGLAEAEPSRAVALAKVADAVAASTAPALRSRLEGLSNRCDVLAEAMDFAFLYKPDRNLFTIGLNLAQNRLDASCYDLLASECSLTSYLAVARGDAPRKHWFQLGRPYIRAADRVGLMSWGGTMFEYLMPRLMLKALPGTLIAEAIGTAVDRQIEFGRHNNVPWGISESAFSSQYVDGDYQYQSFGVPGLGLKRGLDKDLVVAPYATMLAVVARPHEAVANFRRLAAEGAEGAYGFYEAIDYTAGRVPKGQKSVVCRSFMAHHQGMGLVAITNLLLDEPMPRRFQAEPMVRAAELLLQERVPRDAPIVEPSAVDPASPPPPDAAPRPDTPSLMSRRLTNPDSPSPRTHLLSNGGYSVMVTNAAAGYSTCRGADVTRWREDATRDDHGQFVYIHDLENHHVWSAGHQPTCRPAEVFEALFAADKATFRRLDNSIETRLEITVSPESDVEVRRLTLTNRDTRARELELTSYAELAMQARTADVAHPAFGKLFLETEWLPGPGALICRRRPRAEGEAPSFAVHVSSLAGAVGGGEVQHETDRAAFLGRGRSTADPQALDPGWALTGTVGAVLDPIFALRRKVRIASGATAVVAFATAVAPGRDEALAIADQFRDAAAANRAFELAWAHAQIEHRNQHISSDDAHQYMRLAAHVIYAGTALRADQATIEANRLGQPGLWQHGISGDRPIVLAQVGGMGEIALAREALAAHAYLRSRGLEIDLVLLDEEPGGYREDLHESLRDLARTWAGDLVDKPGGAFVRKSSTMTEDDRNLLRAYARVVLIGERGPLAGQLDRVERLPISPPPLAPSRAPSGAVDPEPPAMDLDFPNGHGGFGKDGLDYIIVVPRAGRTDVRRNGKPAREPLPRPSLPPAPWSNVVANPGFGFLATEAGLGMTWAGNSQANKLTPWSNDPVADTPGEAVYLRDEETGEVWSPTPLPAAHGSTVIVRHGRGYTTWSRLACGIHVEMIASVAADEPIKFLHLVVHNPGPRTRKLSATYYAEWVLGADRGSSAMRVVTEVDSETGALLARSPGAPDFGDAVAFADVSIRPRSVTADRNEFLGRNGSPAAPAALRRLHLSGRTGAAIDPCAAIMAPIEVAPGGTVQVAFVLGQAADAPAARDLVRRHADPIRAAEATSAAVAGWDRILGTVQVKTPDPAMDLMLNRWLPYQSLACRVWGRSAFYQSGGAYGFRDQLQDAMALVNNAPGEARAQLLRAAAHQFVEGDVQHWWHPPSGRGVRTRISDDLAWLPYVAAHYVEATGDMGVLDDRAPFLQSALLKPGQEDDYGLPGQAEADGTLYEHCVRALDKASTRGAHGLPLMGTGDWNDGMNRVGAEGRGESVWLAWFLMAAHDRFARVAEARGDAHRSAECHATAAAYAEAVEAHAWDGDWYRRAYFDDGTPMGTAGADECRIDSIAQSWAVLSGRAPKDHADRAMAAVDRLLIRRQDKLVLLFTPPFDHGQLHPGYIRGYVPGIRENGGQYTHASTWVAYAAAMQGRGEDSWAIFDMLSPVRHAADPEGARRYKVEPYVVAADVYGVAPHIGRGGWTWYTGSAAWLYRVGVEAILGLHRRGHRLRVDPCIPAGWPGFEVRWRSGGSTYVIAVDNLSGAGRGVAGLRVDGVAVGGCEFDLVDDGREHRVEVSLGAPLP